MNELSVQELFDEAFQPGRSPRSEAYKLGVLHVLQMWIDGQELAPCPYKLGTAEADAYYAGVTEGTDLSRKAGYPTSASHPE